MKKRITLAQRLDLVLRSGTISALPLAKVIEDINNNLNAAGDYPERETVRTQWTNEATNAHARGLVCLLFTNTTGNPRAFCQALQQWTNKPADFIGVVYSSLTEPDD